jgi:hypothetical protein
VPRRCPRRQNHGNKSKKKLSDPRLLDDPRNYRSYFSLPLRLFSLFPSLLTHFFYLILYSYSFHTTIPMSAPGAGHEFPAQEVSWQKRDVLLFANSIGVKADELHFLYVCHELYIYLSKYHNLTISRNFTRTSQSSQPILSSSVCLSTPGSFGRLH